MNSESYKIIISISHHRIAFEYWQRDGENKLVGMPSGQWPAPLAFFCSDTGIVIGEDAVRAAHSGTTNAFDNYFDLLAQPDVTYTLGGQTHPIRNLLLDAAEGVFHDFFRLVLLNRFGSLSDNRANMPLTIVCEADIRPNEKALLYGLFKDSGYSRVRVVEYAGYVNKFIHETLSKEYVCDKVVVAWAEDADLTFSLFGVNNDSAPIVKVSENLGIDPRKEYVEDMIWDRVISQNPWFQRVKEQEAISRAAAEFLCSDAPLVNDEIILSDGRPYRYSLNRNTVNYQSSDGVSIKEELDQFLRNNGIINRSRVLMLLRGTLVGNSYFVENLSPGFSKTIKSDKKLRDNAMRLIIAEPTPLAESEPPRNNTPKPPAPDRLALIAKKWRQVKAEAKGKERSGQIDVAVQMLKDFSAECQGVSGADGILDEIVRLLASFSDESKSSDKKDTPTPPPTSILSTVKSLQRKWREVKATASGKGRGGNKAEARRILQEFLDSVMKVPGASFLISTVEKEISLLATATPAPPKSKHYDGEMHPNGKWVWVASAAGGKGDWRVIGARTHTQHLNNLKTEGETLIETGKLKEARDWYRTQGDTSMTSNLTAIIRAKKEVDVRKASIGQHQKTKNREQINRIIKEIQDFVALCDKVKMDSSEYKQLISDYRKI